MKGTRSAAKSSNRVRQVFRHVRGNVKVDVSQIAYPNGCFVLAFQHHHGSQLPAAVMVHWRSFSRFGSSQLQTSHPHVTVIILHLRVTAGKKKRILSRRLCHLSHVSRDHTLRSENIYHDRSPRRIGRRKSKLVAMGQQPLGPGSTHVTIEPTSIQYGFSALGKKSRHDVGHITLSFVRFEIDWKHSRHVPTVRKRMTGKYACFINNTFQVGIHKLERNVRSLNEWKRFLR